jgi:sugar phosphate permease
LHKIGARVWLARILITWGIVAVLTGFAKTAPHLYVLRFLLGLAEAGYIPGIFLYLTYWFPQRYLARAIALFCTANPVASVLGAPISGVILDHVHWLGLSSWRWLLILEGFPAIVGGVLTYFLLPGRPSEASFLAPEEKQWIIAELEREERQKVGESRITAGHALVHGRVWHLTAAYFLALIGLYSMTFWMPQLVKILSTEYSNTTVGVLVMIPYAVALPFMILISRSSDQRSERRYHSAIPLIVSAIGFLLLGTITKPSVFLSMTLWCFVAIGIYSLLGPFWALPPEFLTGASAAAGIALVNSIGNLGGFVGPYVIGASGKAAGNFQKGLLFSALSLFGSAILLLSLRRERF